MLLIVGEYWVDFSWTAISIIVEEVGYFRIIGINSRICVTMPDVILKYFYQIGSPIKADWHFINHALPYLILWNIVIHQINNDGCTDYWFIDKVLPCGISIPAHYLSGICQHGISCWFYFWSKSGIIGKRIHKGVIELVHKCAEIHFRLGWIIRFSVIVQSIPDNCVNVTWFTR